ncbi:MAG: tetratricopeptide repeat protein [Motiliproteus sp.]
MLPINNRTGMLFSLLAIAAISISGCANRQQTIEPAAETSTEQRSSSAQEQPSLPKSSFLPSTLYALMVAEMAAHRGLPRVTLHNYLQEAEKTGDLGIIQRSVELSNHLRDSDAMLKATTLWAKAEPDNPTPFRIATKELISRGEVDKALPLLEKALQLGSLEVIDALTSRVQRMDTEERQSYLALINKMLLTDPDNAQLIYGKAALVAAQDDLDQALTLTQQALSLTPDFERAILLEADLQNRTGHLDTALGHLREELRDLDSKQMRTLYTRLLLEKKQYPQAEQQAEMLINKSPDDHSLQFYLGVLLLEHNRLDLSEHYFSKLAEESGHNSALSYYQGRIAQIKNQSEQALVHYRQVSDAPYLLAAYTEIIKLLTSAEDQAKLSQIFAQAKQNHSESSAMFYALEAAWLVDHSFDLKAMELLDQGLGEHPENTRLRYSRAMLGEKLGNMTLMESDLRFLLKLEPDNATAMNALGYSLTDNTGRHSEALELIKKALALKPDDPAILDSMGWAYYHLGELQLSLQYLQQAFNNFPDPEIAAHLGSVNWALGNKAEALKIWQEALEQQPDNRYIIDAMEAAEKGI